MTQEVGAARSSVKTAFDTVTEGFQSAQKQVGERAKQVGDTISSACQHCTVENAKSIPNWLKAQFWSFCSLVRYFTVGEPVSAAKERFESAKDAQSKIANASYLSRSVRTFGATKEDVEGAKDLFMKWLSDGTDGAAAVLSSINKVSSDMEATEFARQNFGKRAFDKVVYRAQGELANVEPTRYFTFFGLRSQVYAPKKG